MENKHTCEECMWYWKNNDTVNECEGQDEPCHEFIQMIPKQIEGD